MLAMTPMPGNPQVIVDLSNVCRDARLAASPDEASWARFERLMEAWQRSTGATAEGVAIADANLRYRFGAADRKRFSAAERSGVVRTVAGSADPEILRWADASGA